MRRCLCGLVGLPSCDHYLSFRNPIGQSQSPNRMSMYHDFLVPFSCGSSAWRRSFHALTLTPKPRRRVRDLRVASRSLRARVSSYHRHSETTRAERSLDGSLVPRRLGRRSCLLSHSVAPHHCLHSPHVLLCPLRSQPCACMCLYEPGPLLEPPRSQSLLPLLSHAPPPPPLLRPRQMRALSPHSCCPSASKSGSVVSSRL